MSMLAGATGSNQSILGTIGGIIGGVGGFITGGPGGAVAGATAGREIGDAINGPSGGPPPPSPSPGGMTPYGFTGLGGTPGGTNCDLTSMAGFNNWVAGRCFTSSGGTAPVTGAGCMKGYHLNKQTLNPTRGGCGRQAHGVVAKHTVLVRNRHMHPGNAKAANRAIHRLKAAHRIFKRIDKIVGRRSSGRSRSSSCGCKKH